MNISKSRNETNPILSRGQALNIHQYKRKFRALLPLFYSLKAIKVDIQRLTPLMHNLTPAKPIVGMSYF
jgi:hypothetical protein